MSETIYKSSKLVFEHNLKNLSAILKRASRDAKARNIDPVVLLHARLAPDMHPVHGELQLQAATGSWNRPRQCFFQR